MYGSVTLARQELTRQRAFYERVMVDGAVSDVSDGFIVSDVVMNNNATIFFVRDTSVIRITVTLAEATEGSTEAAACLYPMGGLGDDVEFGGSAAFEGSRVNPADRGARTGGRGMRVLLGRRRWVALADPGGVPALMHGDPAASR